ncbi:hypothetical protein ABAC460_04925 [Asticcacaulis sp. AC460]|uniref:SGNH/GDSL hydrolase family protein n=1 Tax=Asticcacaulis sp. AC460 TaxID=1282360 RepID=UPI0003C3CCF3|nr:SGNH/GDSL hydrolase family protein [Asticcacaulis sp. AC460]ESQ92237.1 hypothetical protein ABAC460_04925 [Asticcacaulis sp. AC460]
MRHLCISALALPTVLLAACLVLAPPVLAKDKQPHWVAAWGSSQMIAEGNNALTPEQLTDATLRQVVRVTYPGQSYRVRLSNIYGKEPLTVDSVRIARIATPDTSTIDTATTAKVLFGGRDKVTIPAGADYLSDPVAVDLPGLSDAAISLHIATPPMVQTGHPGARTPSYLVKGNRVDDAALADATVFQRWYLISGLEVAAKPKTRAIVAFGDSITDGYGVKDNRNTRWGDGLMKRLAATGRPLPVLNGGIGGNRMLLDGLGPNALARFDREVLSPPNVGYVILLEGVNDLGTLTRDASATPEAHADLVANVTAGYAQLIHKARSQGIKVYGATVMPYAGNTYYHPEPVSEADRQAINAWIRTPGNFDAVIDFDAAMRDPAQPDRLLPAYDSGDHLHPSEAGYKAMADAVPLELFK